MDDVSIPTSNASIQGFHLQGIPRAHPINGGGNLKTKGWPSWLYQTPATRGLEPRRPKDGTSMNVETTVRIDGREVATLKDTRSLPDLWP